jgi:hypothetical protein
MFDFGGISSDKLKKSMRSRKKLSRQTFDPAIFFSFQ